jgi:hypothetical protein
VLDIDGGPELRVTIVQLEGNDAVLQLASPEPRDSRHNEKAPSNLSA